ncbi:MAG TPA: AAA family ATPase [Gaiellaceae bacterium]|nr:AAA family ATPase [Gaiellaceae bacterium]
MGATVEDLPGGLRLTPTFPFVGRRRELEALRALMPWTVEGRRVALVAGEAGSGKSRLVREFSLETAEKGALVLYGACDAVVRTPYGAFVEALDHLADVSDPAELRLALGPRGGELMRLVPDLPARVGELPAPIEADPDTERHRLHTAFTELMAAVGHRRPLLVVVEDAHWADVPTLLLFRHLVRSAGRARVLLLATFRDAEADVPAPLAEALADLRRSDDVVRLRLEGLSDDEVAEFVRRAAGCEPGAELAGLAAAIRELTGGNPFLVSEVWRALVETGSVELAGAAVRVVRPPAALGPPESVREVVGERLVRLDPSTTELLELAATAGSDLHLDLLRRASGVAEPQLLAAIEDGVRSGMIEELPTPGLGWRFTHELVRQALYDRLSRARRAELHFRVAEALEASGSPTGRTLADLAHHFAAAAPFGGVERAVEYNLRAARAAADALAFDEAVARLRTALDLGIDDPVQRGEALLELGIASHRAGMSTDALEAFAAAAELARGLGSAELLAQAAIGYEDASWRPGVAGGETVDLLEEAIAALAEGSPELRVGLLAGLARVLDRQGDGERGAAVRSSAVALARALDDRTWLAKVLARSYWSRGTSRLEEIAEMLDEAKQLAEELGDTELRAEAMAWRVPTFVALCDMDGAGREAAALLEVAERTAQPFMRHIAEHYGSALALCDGRLAEAESMAGRSHEWSQLLTGRDASGVYGIQMFSIRREQGRLAELAPLVRVLAAGAERSGPWRPGLVALLAELGMEAEARGELAHVAADGLDALRGSIWLGALTYLADAASALDDEAVAGLVYPELAPLSGGNIMIGHLVSCYGAADRYLGMLAGTLGESSRAEEHFERALALNRRMGASTWVAHTAYEYARLLVRRGGANGAADVLLDEAEGLAGRIGMPALLGRIAALRSRSRAVARPDDLSPREVQVLQLVARGLSNREIGATLLISEHTAANHIRSILRKTGCANRTEAASYAHRHQLVV